MKKQTYLVLLFGGNMVSKLIVVGALVSRGIEFEYTGEYIRVMTTKKNLFFELSQCNNTNELEDATFFYEEVDADGKCIRMQAEEIDK